MKLLERLKKNNAYKEWVTIGLLGIKPITDMFYAARWLDTILLAGLMIIAVLYLDKNIFKQCKENRIVVVWLVLLILSLILSIKGTYWIGWIKLMSIFPVYVVGLYFSKQYTGRLLKVLQLSYAIVLAVNLILLITGNGYQTWAQDAQTFTGLYYFKTDLAVAMAQVLLFALASYSFRWPQWGMAILAIVIALLTNSRIFFAIIILLVLVCGFWGHLYGKKLHFGKIAGFVVGILILSVFLITGLASLPFFKERNFISFTTEGSLWDMMVYNLMSRNIIWRDMLEGYSQGNFGHILFGNGIASYMPWYDAHSLYVSTIYKFGIVGCVALVYLCVWAWITLRDKADRRLYFLNIGFWIIFLVAGISYTTAESTQYTWLMAFFMAAVASRQKQESIDQNDETRESINCS